MTYRLDLTLDQVPYRSLNDRTHWRNRQRHAADARLVVGQAVKATRGDTTFDVAHIAVTFRAPDRRRRDPDNLLGAVKPLIDGLVDGGLLPDDSAMQVARLCLQIVPSPDDPGWTVHVEEAA